MDIVTYISIIIGILGIIGTFYFGFKSVYLQQKIKKYDWKDVEIGIEEISNKIFKKFQPDVLLSLSGPGSIVANLMLTKTAKFIPLYVGISKKINSKDFTFEPQKMKTITTTRWKTYIPDEIFKLNNKRIVIIEDAVITGDTLNKLVNVLIKNGIKRKNILTISLFTTELAVSSNKGPNIYWIKQKDSDFYLPWGNCLGKGY
ncbi:phosphoribosyltransferase family protein [Thermoplasmatota archaeon]